MEERRRTRLTGGTPRVSEGAPAWVGRALDPVVGILLLAGLFDAMAGNPVHGLALSGAGLGLVVVPPRIRRVVVRGPSAAGDRTAPGRRWWWVALPVSIAYGVVVGGLERYTWPVTFAILAPGITALVVASRSRRSASPARGDRARVGPWVAVLIGLGVFELVNFVLQPSRLVGSFDHPTLSTLFNDVVVSHPEQAIALAVWLFAGWWLVER